MTIDSFITHHRLALKLKSALVGELFLIRRLKHPAYVFKGGAFRAVLPEGTTPTKDQISALLKNTYREIYLYADDIKEIKGNLENALIKVTRSLSVGDPLENGNKDIKLLSFNMKGLYQDPHSDEKLMLQFQSTQNLSKFLIENRKLQSQFYLSLQKGNFHFTLAQPMLSSLLLLSFLQSIHLFHNKEIENIFLASYLKDIGISMIPRDKYDQKVLTEKDQQLFAVHADFSTDLLEGRVPLSKNYLSIIKNHHFLNDRMKELAGIKSERGQEVVMGLESMLVAVFDVLVATTSDRPYRKGMSLYQGLELIKKMMADDYPQEFRALVVFLKQFYKF
jgi:hypothetical protein